MLNGLKNLPGGIAVRPARKSDSPFLRKISDDKFSALKEHPKLSRDQVEHLMEMQLLAQSGAYGEMFPNAAYFIVEKNGQSIGKLSLEWDGESARLVDLGFVQKAQGKGFGKIIIRALVAACDQGKCPLIVTCPVTKPALMAFLQSYDFIPVSDPAGAAHILMKRDISQMPVSAPRQ